MKRRRCRIKRVPIKAHSAKRKVCTRRKRRRKGTTKKAKLPVFGPKNRRMSPGEKERRALGYDY